VFLFQVSYLSFFIFPCLSLSLMCHCSFSFFVSLSRPCVIALSLFLCFSLSCVIARSLSLSLSVSLSLSDVSLLSFSLFVISVDPLFVLKLLVLAGRCYEARCHLVRHGGVS